MWQILNGVWPEVANMSRVRRYRPRNAPSPVSLPDLHDCYKDGEESDYSRHHGNQPEARTDRIWTTIDRVVLWDNHSWNWAAYLLISDRIRVNASSLFFICVLKIPLLKVLKCLHFFFFCFLFLFEVWNVSPSSCSWSDSCHLSRDKVGFILETLPRFSCHAFILKSRTSEALWFTNSVQVDFSALSTRRHGYTPVSTNGVSVRGGLTVRSFRCCRSNSR